MAIEIADVAQNIAGQMTHWATLIIIPTAAIMALPALFNRDVKHVLVIGGIALLVGAFAYDGKGVQRFITNVAETVFG